MKYRELDSHKDKYQRGDICITNNPFLRNRMELRVTDTKTLVTYGDNFHYKQFSRFVSSLLCSYRKDLI